MNKLFIIVLVSLSMSTAIRGVDDDPSAKAAQADKRLLKKVIYTVAAVSAGAGIVVASASDFSVPVNAAAMGAVCGVAAGTIPTILWLNFQAKKSVRSLPI